MDTEARAGGGSRAPSRVVVDDDMTSDSGSGYSDEDASMDEEQPRKAAARKPARGRRGAQAVAKPVPLEDRVKQFVLQTNWKFKDFNEAYARIRSFVLRDELLGVE
jgi:hypothetical protein